MWFKNLIIYSITGDLELDPEKFQEALQNTAFTPCGRQELSAYGWTSPMGPKGESLLHSSSGFYLICGKKEERILPASVIKDFVNERVTLIEDEQMRKVRKKEREELKDQVMLELTPKAFTRSTVTYALIAPELGYLIVDASSAKKADEITSYLRKSIGSLPIKPLNVNDAPTSLFTAWLDGKADVPQDLVVGNECELKAGDEDGATIRCSKFDLDCDEIKAHLKAGKHVVKLALEWNEALNFVLDNELNIKKLKFSDTIEEQASNESDGDAAAEFDAQFTLSALELTRFIPRLTEIFGGEVKAE